MDCRNDKMADTAIPDDSLDYQNSQSWVKDPDGEAMPKTVNVKEESTEQVISDCYQGTRAGKC